MVAILLSRPPSYGCALIILQTCVMCFAIYLVTSWKNDLNYSEKEPSECYITLSRHSKILFPQKPIVWCVGGIDKVCSRCTIWCTIFLIKPFEVLVFPWCTRAPKVYTRISNFQIQDIKFFQPWINISFCQIFFLYFWSSSRLLEILGLYMETLDQFSQCLWY